MTCLKLPPSSPLRSSPSTLPPLLHLSSLPFSPSPLPSSSPPPLPPSLPSSVLPPLCSPLLHSPQDPNSLANLDQDLPNNMVHSVPIYSLPQDWLWCETWCSNESKAHAKTIDLVRSQPDLEQMSRAPLLHVHAFEPSFFLSSVPEPRAGNRSFLFLVWRYKHYNAEAISTALYCTHVSEGSGRHWLLSCNCGHMRSSCILARLSYITSNSSAFASCPGT